MRANARTTIFEKPAAFHERKKFTMRDLPPDSGADMVIQALAKIRYNAMIHKSLLLLLACLLLAALYPATSFAAVPTLSGTTVSWISTNTVSSAKATIANLGATISSNGGEAILERGIVWNTTGAPTVADNKFVAGGTAVGTFTANVTGLTAASIIYFQGYATNLSGTSYSGVSSFHTEPATAATVNVTAPSGANYFDLKVNYTVPAGADGVLVVGRQTSAPAKAPADGTAYTASDRFGDGETIVPGCLLYCEYVVANAHESGNVTVSGLKAGINHFFAVYAYKGSETGISGINYMQNITSAGPVATDPVPPEGKSHNQQWVPDYNTPAGCARCHGVHHTSQLLPTGLDQLDKCQSCHRAGGLAAAKTNIGLHPADGSVDCGTCHSMHSFRTEELYSTNHAGVKGFNKSFIRANMRKYMNPTDYPPWAATTQTALDNTVFQNRATDFAFASEDPARPGKFNGVCQSCHTSPDVKHYTQTGADGHQAGRDCMVCHKHADEFLHGVGGTGCNSCHGHEDGYQGAPAGTYFGSTQSHSTHTESDNDLIGPRPILACTDCHNTGKFPLFRSKADANAELTLAQTDICDTCHSANGPYDGLNDPEVGAKNNWRNGIYTGTALTAGKEKWCVTCHDAGTSLINGRQAPDVARNNTANGYYVSGHGAQSIECAGCHGLTMSHNFDGSKTYIATSDNYQAAYRLTEPLNIPNPNDFGLGCNYNSSDFQLCYKCHDEQKLLNDTRADGVYECNTNPYKNAASITTGFRNMLAAGFNGGAGDWPANIHWDHLADIHSIFSGSSYWDSDKNGANDSKASCITCHNPHGEALADGNPTKRMTRQDMQIEWGNDATYGDYGRALNLSTPTSVCFSACHFNPPNEKYYRTSPVPVLSEIQAADKDGADPSPADAGFTNNRTVRITFTVSGVAPAEMRFAEDATFTQNATAWLPYAAFYDYTLSECEGSKTVYARIKSGDDLSEVKSAAIIVDTIPPAVTASTLSSPNGGETWLQDSAHDITWSGISDTHLKPVPIALEYSTDSGATFPGTIAAGEANDGAYPWIVPVAETTKAKVRVTATDKAGNQASDTSDGDFTIASVTPVLSTITASDSNGGDPAPAEAGYTNKQSVTVTLTASNNPAEMQLSEDPTFTGAPWIPFASPATFSLSGTEGSKTIYCKVKNGAGESGVQSASITLDLTAPDLPVLTAPNGGEFWTRNTDQTIVWNPGSIADPAPGALKASPVTLAYSTDSGGSYPNTIAAGIANSGSHLWHTPVPVSYFTKVRLTVTDRAGNQSLDDSDNVLAISPPTNYIVTNTSDAGIGSLRQAITDLVAAGGNDTIWFNIPNADLTNGVAVISIPVLSEALPPLSQPGIVIDGRSQKTLNGDTNPNGPEVRLHGLDNARDGLSVTAADVAVYGLQLTKWWTGFKTNAARTTLADSHVGFASDTTGFDGTNAQKNYGNIVISSPASNTLIGGAEGGNYISCSWIITALADSGTGSEISDNIFGLLPNGTECSNNGLITLNTSASTVRNNIICGGGTGINISSNGNTIQGNTMGVWHDGTGWHDCTDQYEAIRIQSASAVNNMIGGSNAATSDDTLNDSNVIDPGTYGIQYVAKSFAGNDFIYGNFIGTNPEQDESFPGTYGIHATSQWYIKVGGGGAGESPNVIANMTGNGFYLNGATGKYITISRNSFYGNGTSADLSDDAIRLDAGANEGIARPSITAATTSTVTVSGVVFGDIVEVFISDYDGAGTEYGEGKTFIGSAVSEGAAVVVDINGAGLTGGEWLTATRTKSTSGSTSAFSTNVQVP